MTTRTTAVFENGLLRPTQPLGLEEGETVVITLQRPLPEPPPSDDEYVRRIRAAKTLEEFMEIANSMPSEDDGYDLLQALDENRRLAGEYRQLCPPDLKGISW